MGPNSARDRFIAPSSIGLYRVQMDLNAIRTSIQTSISAIPPTGDTRYPRLLFEPDDASTIASRANQRTGFMDRLLEQVDEYLGESASILDGGLARSYSAPLLPVSLAYFLTEEKRYLTWVKHRINSLFALESWMAPVHKVSCTYCDHVMTNVAAHIAGAFDLVAYDLSGPERQAIADGVYRLHMSLYLKATDSRDEWWSKEVCESNWKIMSYGDSGYTACCFAGYWPESVEAITRAAVGVVEILDMVPPEGDWPEGINYWFATLMLGLRFARALFRISDGAVNLFSHPALQVTGEYAAALTTPGGNVYNFGDNGPKLGETAADALYLLADAANRSDLLHLARSAGGYSIISLAADDPEIKVCAPIVRAARFPRSGVATCRSGHSADDSFLGFRCGPSDVGHSHLDAASFVFEYRGTPLLWGETFWPYAHFLGFFDTRGYRWNWDNLATVGHNTLLVDDQGQSFGSEYSGKLLDVVEDDRWCLVGGDASACYPGLLERFVRSILFVYPDTLIVRDTVVCSGERHVAWLMHPVGEVSDAGECTLIRNGDCELVVTPLLPDRTNGFRVSDVSRKTIYEASNTGEIVAPAVRYRSFEPIRKARNFEFLMVMQAGTSATQAPEFEWQSSRVDSKTEGWCISFERFSVEADGDSMRYISVDSC